MDGGPPLEGAGDRYAVEHDGKYEGVGSCGSWKATRLHQAYSCQYSVTTVGLYTQCHIMMMPIGSVKFSQNNEESIKWSSRSDDML
eukprot:9498374-Pyramimonas_sp.AAC.2